ncbi:hypothetical protein FRC10_007011, partial [Ceratobasidium sp. 414]
MNTQEVLNSKHLKLRMQAGAYWDREREEFHTKSDKIIHSKARKSGGLLYPDLTNEPLDDPLSNSNSRMGPSTSNPIDSINLLTGKSRGHSATASAAGGAWTAAPACGQCGTTGNTEAGAGAGGAMGPGQACPASQSPSPIPGTPGADSEVTEHCDFINGINPTGTESGYNNYIESLNPADLSAEFCRFVRPKAPALSSQEISVQLQQYATHYLAPVASPKRQVEVNQLSQKSFSIGRNNTARIDDSGPHKRSSPRQAPKHSKHQKVADKGKEHTGTETETETENENECAETKTEAELLSPRYQPIFPTYSLLPLPPVHVPSVTNALGLLGLPSGWPGAASLGTTQASTQDPVAQPGNPACPLAQMSAVTTESLNTQCLPTPSQPAHNRPPLGTQSQPSQATAHTHLTSADSSRTPACNNPMSTQKKVAHSSWGQGIMGAVSGSSAKLLDFIQNS